MPIEENKEVIIKQLAEIVACRKLHPRAFILVEQCAECEYFKGIQNALIFYDAEGKPDPKKPPHQQIRCGLPTPVPVETMIKLEE